MTAEQLKASILQMAIEGRLVPQLDDEPAVNIAGEVPEEVPFAIPEKWKWMRLETVCKSIVDGDHMPPPKVGEGIPFLVISNISSGYINFQNTHFVPESYYEALQPSRKPEKDDILLAVTGSLGVSVMVNTKQRFTFQRHIALLKPKYEYILPKYILILLRTRSLCNKIKEISTGIAQKTVSIKALRKVTIPLSPLAEQRRIVARFEELLPLVEEYGNAHAALKKAEEALPDQLRASLLQEAIQGKLVPQLDDEPAVDIAGEEPDEVPFAIPEKWKWIFLGDAVVYGKAEQAAGSNIPKDAWILDLEDIEKERGVVLQKKRGIATTSNKSRFYKGNVLYSKLRPYLNKVVVAEEDGYCTTEIIPIDPRSNGYEIDADYLKTYLMSPYFVHYANERSYGVKMPRLGTKDAKAAAFPLPPLAEQRRIVARLEELLPHVDAMAG